VFEKGFRSYATGLFVLPSTNDGTLAELRWLKATGNFRDCVFFLPGPQPGHDYVRRWDELREALMPCCDCPTIPVWPLCSLRACRISTCLATVLGCEFVGQSELPDFRGIAAELRRQFCGRLASKWSLNLSTSESLAICMWTRSSTPLHRGRSLVAGALSCRVQRRRCGNDYLDDPTYLGSSSVSTSRSTDKAVDL
jgi:hypothetical protein